jgi:hypothetical protein
MAESRNTAQKSPASRQIDAIAWALLFIWIGVVVLTKISWGWSLLGVSAIILGAQANLWRVGEKIDSFGVASGVVFLVGGLSELFGLNWSLGPILLILLGAVMLWNAVFGSHAR